MQQVSRIGEQVMKSIVWRVVTGALVAIFIGAGFQSVPAMTGERLAVSVSTANVRQGAGTNYDVRWRVEKYYPVMVIEKDSEWIRFKDFEGDEGWLHESLLKSMNTVVIKKDECNVRTGPGTNHDIAFTVYKGVPFKVIGSQGDWLHVRHADGDTGWVYKPLTW